MSEPLLTAPAESDLVRFDSLSPGDAFEYWPRTSFAGKERGASCLPDGRVSRYVKTNRSHANADAGGGAAVDVLDGATAVFQSSTLVLPRPITL